MMAQGRGSYAVEAHHHVRNRKSAVWTGQGRLDAVTLGCVAVVFTSSNPLPKPSRAHLEHVLQQSAAAHCTAGNHVMLERALETEKSALETGKKCTRNRKQCTRNRKKCTHLEHVLQVHKGRVRLEPRRVL